MAFVFLLSLVVFCFVGRNQKGINRMTRASPNNSHQMFSH